MQGARNTDAETLRLRLREVYRTAARKEHPDWDEYDRVMVEQGRIAVLLRPDRIVGHGV